jgi:uncharacterized membrane protein (UPF0127 family)
MAALGACLVAACAVGEKPNADTTSPAMAFDSARVRLASKSETTVVRVQLALTDPQRAMGLMERPWLAADAGMLFIYPATQPKESAFWMFRTRIPLDIAYVDSSGTIRAIVEMEPCQTVLFEGCPSYPAGVPFRAALEANRGFFRSQRLGLGDHVALADTSVAGRR